MGVGVTVADRSPRLPGDPHDQRADAEADQRVGKLQPEGHRDRAGDDGEADVGIGFGVVAVSDQGGAVERAPGREADQRRQPVAGEAEQTGADQDGEVRDFLGVDQTPDRLDSGDGGRDKDDDDDEVARVALRSLRAHQEGSAERNRGGRVAEVVDQIGEQGDAAGRGEDRHLRGCGESKHGEREGDGPHSRPRAFDRRINQAVGMTVIAVVVNVALVVVRTSVGMSVRQLAVAV